MIKIVSFFILITSFLASCGGQQSSEKEKSFPFDVYMASTSMPFSQASITLESITLTNNKGNIYPLLKTPRMISLAGMSSPVYLEGADLPAGDYEYLTLAFRAEKESFTLPRIKSGWFSEEKVKLIDHAGDDFTLGITSHTVEIQTSIHVSSDGAIVIVFDGNTSFDFLEEKNNQAIFEFKPAFYVEPVEGYSSELTKGHISEDDKAGDEAELKHSIEDETYLEKSKNAVIQYDETVKETPEENAQTVKENASENQANVPSDLSVEQSVTEKPLDQFKKGKIEHINGNLITVKLKNESVVIDSHLIQITSQDEKLAIDANSFHLGQQVYLNKDTSVVRLLPSRFMVQVTDFQDKNDRHEILLVNGLPAGKVFLTQEFVFDKSFVDALGFNPPSNALLEIIGYHHNGINPSLQILDYRYLLINKVKLSLSFQKGFTPVLLKSEVDGKSFLSFTEDTLKNTQAFLTIDEVNVPLKKPLSRIELLTESNYLINIQNDQAQTEIKTSTSTLMYEDLLNLSLKNSLESIEVSGRFDAVEQTLISHHFSVNMKLLNKTPEVPVLEISKTDNDKKYELIKTATISFGAIAGGAAFLYLAYTLRKTHEAAVKAIGEMPIEEMRELIKSTGKAVENLETKLTALDVDSINSTFKEANTTLNEFKSGDLGFRYSRTQGVHVKPRKTKIR